MPENQEGAGDAVPSIKHTFASTRGPAITLVVSDGDSFPRREITALLAVFDKRPIGIMGRLLLLLCLPLDVLRWVLTGKANFL